jgi:cystathionine beta-lyase
MKFNTKTIHAGIEKRDPAYNAVNTPIYQSTTFKIDSPEEHSKFQYSRTSNPTRADFEQTLAQLENAEYGIAFSSGVAAIDAVLKLLKSGDEVITSKDLYGGTYRIFSSIFKNFGIRFHFINLNNSAAIQQYINANTKLIWLETPTNPLLNIVDIKRVSDISKKNKLKLIVDNTFASPYLQNPLDFGADIVMHSASKYLGGHSDVILGALVTNDKALADRLFFIQNASGAIPGPMDCFLISRGIKTLHLRMQRHCENAKTIAHFLKTHSRVEKVYWPGFSDHPNHLIAKNQMRNFGGVVSFSLNDNTQKAAIALIKKLKIFTLAESLGGVESLVGHPASMSHASIPKAEREKAGISNALIRLSVGIEDKEDLILDLKSALEKLQ